VTNSSAMPRGYARRPPITPLSLQSSRPANSPQVNVLAFRHTAASLLSKSRALPCFRVLSGIALRRSVILAAPCVAARRDRRRRPHVPRVELGARS
jgi:hypothetical protein